MSSSHRAPSRSQTELYLAHENDSLKAVNSDKEKPYEECVLLVQNLWDLTKVVLREKYIAIQASLKNLKFNQINNLYCIIKNIVK